MDLKLAIEEVEHIEQMLEDMIAQHEDYINWMNQHRDQYEDEVNQMQENYDNASTAAKEEYKNKIMNLYAEFNQGFEESNKHYIARMNDLTASLYAKVAAVNQHSMVQRSMIMNIYQDYCDGLFYVAFVDCYFDEDLPSMSDSFDSLLFKLKEVVHIILINKTKYFRLKTV